MASFTTGISTSRAPVAVSACFRRPSLSLSCSSAVLWAAPYLVQSSAVSGEVAPSSACLVLMADISAMASVGLDGISIRNLLLAMIVVG